MQLTIVAGSVERADGTFVPAITVNGAARYFMSPAGQPQHVRYANGVEAREYAEQRTADLQRTVMNFLQESGFIIANP